MKRMFVGLLIIYSAIQGAASPEFQFHMNIFNKNIDEVRKVLNNDPDAVNRPLTAGRSPLHIAASVNALEIAELLIMRGADVNPITSAPLRTAVSVGHADMVELLLRHNANVEIRDPDDHSTVLDIQPGWIGSLPDTDPRVIKINKLLAPYKKKKAEKAMRWCYFE